MFDIDAYWSNYAPCCITSKVPQVMFVFCRGRGGGGPHGGFGGGKSSVQNEKLIIFNKGRALFCHQ